MESDTLVVGAANRLVKQWIRTHGTGEHHRERYARETRRILSQLSTDELAMLRTIFLDLQMETELLYRRKASNTYDEALITGGRPAAK